MTAETLPACPLIRDSCAFEPRGTNVRANSIVREPEYLQTSDAAAYLGVSKKFLEICRARGSGPRFTKVKRIVRYRRSALDRWMSLHEHRPSRLELPPCHR